MLRQLDEAAPIYPQIPRLLLCCLLNSSCSKLLLIVDLLLAVNRIFVGVIMDVFELLVDIGLRGSDCNLDELHLFLQHLSLGSGDGGVEGSSASRHASCDASLHSKRLEVRQLFVCRSTTAERSIALGDSSHYGLGRDGYHFDHIFDGETSTTKRASLAALAGRTTSTARATSTTGATGATGALQSNGTELEDSRDFGDGTKQAGRDVCGSRVSGSSVVGRGRILIVRVIRVVLINAVAEEGIQVLGLGVGAGGRRVLRIDRDVSKALGLSPSDKSCFLTGRHHRDVGEVRGVGRHRDIVRHCEVVVEAPLKSTWCLKSVDDCRSMVDENVGN